MKVLIFLFIYSTFCSSILAQTNFAIKDTSKYFDIKVSIEKCDKDSCDGKSSFSLYKKGEITPYQVIEVPYTHFYLSDRVNPLVNKNLPYSEQSLVKIGDFNFDGQDDLAICDGMNGVYGDRSYQVYLSSRPAGKFVHNASFSELGQYSGLFEVDKKKRVLRIFDKSGCCWHKTEEYAVVNNRPVKVFSEEEDMNPPDREGSKITTRRLVKGKWQTKIRYKR